MMPLGVADRMTEGTSRVALFIPGLYGGGAERVSLRIASALAEAGWEVDLVVVREEGELVDEIPRQVRVVDLGSRRIATSLLPFVAYLWERRPDVVLSGLQPVNMVAVLGVWMSGLPTDTVITVHSVASKKLGGPSSPANDLRGRLARTVLSIIYSRASRVIAVSKGVASDLVNRVGVEGDTIRVIYNPVVTDELLNRSEKPSSHEWFRDPVPVVVSAGRLVPEKDFTTLIQAFKLVVRDRRARLLILGEGPERTSLLNLVKRLDLESVVNMPGFVNHPVEFMAAASVFVLSSRWEGLGNVLIEALASGVPVVATDCPYGPSEILEDGGYGRLVEVGDVKGLAVAIEKAIDCPDQPATRQERMARAADFSSDRAVQRYDSLLREVSGQ